MECFVFSVRSLILGLQLEDVVRRGVLCRAHSDEQAWGCGGRRVFFPLWRPDLRGGLPGLTCGLKQTCAKDGWCPKGSHGYRLCMDPRSYCQ
ncbi:hypothetical protein NDU88_006561 [Pleurodeles waltl]|uniref:Uncharacterized protein n=1 Tax=Pleurodeles waltl TaxID=8319 RepID=A0AAV7WYK9_PLEWA|nr:hypothetical protein NDU88_006561 [Pleurodeles waltl]